MKMDMQISHQKNNSSWVLFWRCSEKSLIENAVYSKIYLTTLWIQVKQDVVQHCSCTRHFSLARDGHCMPQLLSVIFCIVKQLLGKFFSVKCLKNVKEKKEKKFVAHTPGCKGWAVHQFHQHQRHHVMSCQDMNLAIPSYTIITLAHFSVLVWT